MKPQEVELDRHSWRRWADEVVVDAALSLSLFLLVTVAIGLTMAEEWWHRSFGEDA